MVWGELFGKLENKGSSDHLHPAACGDRAVSLLLSLSRVGKLSQGTTKGQRGQTHPYFSHPAGKGSTESQASVFETTELGMMISVGFGGQMGSLPTGRGPHRYFQELFRKLTVPCCHQVYQMTEFCFQPRIIFILPLFVPYYLCKGLNLAPRVHLGRG